jgi:hypothetical protein
MGFSCAGSALFGIPFLNRLQVADDCVDARLGGFGTQPFSSAFECVAPHRHFTTAMSRHAAAVDDLTQALGREYTAVSSSVLRQVRRRLSQLAGHGAIAASGGTVT